MCASLATERWDFAVINGAIGTGGGGSALEAATALAASHSSGTPLGSAVGAVAWHIGRGIEMTS